MIPPDVFTVEEVKVEPYFDLRKIGDKNGNSARKSGLEITAGQRTMSALIVDLTGQTFVLPVMLTGQNSVVLKMK